MQPTNREFPIKADLAGRAETTGQIPESQITQEEKDGIVKHGAEIFEEINRKSLKSWIGKGSEIAGLRSAGLVDVRLVSVRENESQIKALYLEMYQNRLAEVLEQNKYSPDEKGMLQYERAYSEAWQAKAEKFKKYLKANFNLQLAMAKENSIPGPEKQMAYQHGIAKQDQERMPQFGLDYKSELKVDESVKDLPVEVYFGLGSKEVSVKYELPDKIDKQKKLNLEDDIKDIDQRIAREQSQKKTLGLFGGPDKDRLAGLEVQKAGKQQELEEIKRQEKEQEKIRGNVEKLKKMIKKISDFGFQTFDRQALTKAKTLGELSSLVEISLDRISTYSASSEAVKAKNKVDEAVKERTSAEINLKNQEATIRNFNSMALEEQDKTYIRV
ncbi:MAG: hypothetical protein AAB729_05335 [Patescibacteria group bacterium]